VGLVLLVGGLFVYIGYAINENNKKTCRLYELIYQPRPDTPIPDPETRAGEARAEIGKLINEYDCREK